MKKLIVLLIVLMAVPAMAGPTLGSWDSDHPRATHQVWDFSNATEVVNAAYYNWGASATDMKNVSAIAQAWIRGEYDPATNSFSPLQGEDSVDVWLEIGNFLEPRELKEIWIAVGHQGNIDAISMAGIGDLDYTVKILAGPGPGTGADFGAIIRPNPAKEDIWFSITGLATTGGPPELTSIHVDTICIPAPGAMILGSIGVSFVGWLRRRRSL